MKRLLILSLFCFGLLASSADAKVCSPDAYCPIPTLKEDVANSKAVFSGTVIKIEKDGDVKIITLQVNRFWKGNVRRRIKLYILETMRYGGVFYETGKNYLVIAIQDSQGRLSDRRCSNSKPLGDAAYDLKQLGKGKRPK